MFELSFLIYFVVFFFDGKFIVVLFNLDILDDVIIQLNYFRIVDGMFFEDVIINIRGFLVLQGYLLCFFRWDMLVLLLDKLCFFVVMYKFCVIVSYWKERGVDFFVYIYVLEVDFIIEGERYDRGDYNYFFRRMVKSV